jgi:hypothetical protein
LQHNIFFPMTIIAVTAVMMFAQTTGQGEWSAVQVRRILARLAH